MICKLIYKSISVWKNLRISTHSQLPLAGQSPKYMPGLPLSGRKTKNTSFFKTIANVAKTLF